MNKIVTTVMILLLLSVLDGANMRGARLNGANHVFAGTSKSTICPDSTNGPYW